MKNIKCCLQVIYGEIEIPLNFFGPTYMLVGQPAARQMYISVQCRKLPLVQLHTPLRMHYTAAGSIQKIERPTSWNWKRKAMLLFITHNVRCRQRQMIQNVWLNCWNTWEWISKNRKAARRLQWHRGPQTPGAINKKMYIRS